MLKNHTLGTEMTISPSSLPRQSLGQYVLCMHYINPEGNKLRSPAPRTTGESQARVGPMKRLRSNQSRHDSEQAGSMDATDQCASFGMISEGIRGQRTRICGIIRPVLGLDPDALRKKDQGPPSQKKIAAFLPRILQMRIFESS